MSSNGNNSAPGRPFKPTLTSTRSVDRSPLTPRLAASATQSTPSIAARRAPVSTPRIKSTQDAGNIATPLSSDNVTPRSAKRRSRVEGSITPIQSLESPELSRISHAGSPFLHSAETASSVSGLMLSRPVAVRSPLSDAPAARVHAPFMRSPVIPESNTTREDGSGSGFFHASDIGRIEPELRKSVPKKSSAFFYADGQQEQPSRSSLRAASPPSSENKVLSTWMRPSSEGVEGMPAVRAPAMLSPALSAISSSSPFFAPAAQVATQKPRSPSPSKDSIHLSYRKGASQIFGSRPSPIPSQRTIHEISERRPSLQRTIHSHRKSTSLSSIDSGLSRRSNTAHDLQESSPLREEDSIGTSDPQPPKSPLASIDVSHDNSLSDFGALSPTKSVSELAADARRERKVLDLEISNSSLLAINASLEREMRRQKAELKRFRRLTRAGRFTLNSQRCGSGSLGTVDDYDDALDNEFADFGPASGLSELYDDISDSDEDSSLASGDTSSHKGHTIERLAKDERRLRADLDKHRELLVQSQMMNQSLRRCMYATEEMIKEGRKAVSYRVRVSDVRLGGRILTGHEEEDAEDEDGHPVEEIVVEDEFVSAGYEVADDHAQSFVELWGGLGKLNTPNGDTAYTTVDGHESADRDSGIEVDNPAQRLAGQESATTTTTTTTITTSAG